MHVTVQTEGAPLRAHHAVLLYGEGNRSYCSIHAVGEDANGALRIEPGQAATHGALTSLFEALDPARRDRPRLIAENILSRGANWLVWWARPQRRRVWFAGDSIGDRCAEVPHPGLVFAVFGSAWYVFAVKGTIRPSEDSQLYQAPYFNVWHPGKICVGNSALPVGDARHKPEEWERVFFESRFTHPNAHPLVKYSGGEVKFWQAMLAGSYQRFPSQVLLPLKRTLGGMIEQMGGNADGFA